MRCARMPVARSASSPSGRRLFGAFSGPEKWGFHLRFTLEKDIKNGMDGSVHKTNTYGNSCMRFLASAPCFALALAIAGCGARPVAKSEGHILAESERPASAASIPQVVRQAPLPPP